MANMREDALRYHSMGRPGKIEVIPTKPCLTQRDLSLAYTPGVAEPCLDIEKDPDKVFDYTAKGNLVAVISNGTAVLGLGDIGALAGKPVMEGKGVLFKKFADVDVFDIEINETDPHKMVEIIAALEPTFGGINLEDIKAPECFYVEQTLRERMQIPVFHDDQHGTAIISGAGLINAAAVQGKVVSQLKVVIAGAGASGIACAKIWMQLGVQLENILMCDSKGVLHEGRRGTVDASKEQFLRPTDLRTLEEAMRGADVFLGLSKGNTVSKEMVKSMAPRPIIFALANPDSEIPYPDARAAREDAIIGTGRSDYPNQVNNVLGFPFIFRGALDAGARQINEAMKLAASQALAKLAREDVPDRVRAAYGNAALRFGRDYILPKPLDERVLLWVAPAVAKAAMDTGVARKQLDLDEYRDALERRLGGSRSLVRQVVHRVSHAPKRIVFPEAADDRVLRAVPVLVDEKIASPVLLGDPAYLQKRAEEIGVDIKRAEIVPLTGRPGFDKDVQTLLKLRGRRGMTSHYAKIRMAVDVTTVGLIMLRQGAVDGLVAGIQHGYPETIKMALQLVGLRPGARSAVGVHIMVTKQGPLLFADTTVNILPDAKTLADIAITTAQFARTLGMEPHVAMLSYANFGASKHPEATKVAEAVRLVHERDPDLDIEGEMQVQIALDPATRERLYPFSHLRDEANIFVFPGLGAANTAYQMLARAGGADEIGPLLLGLNRPVTVVPPECTVDAIVQLTAMTALHAQPGEIPMHTA